MYRIAALMSLVGIVGHHCVARYEVVKAENQHAVTVRDLPHGYDYREGFWMESFIVNGNSTGNLVPYYFCADVLMDGGKKISCSDGEILCAELGGMGDACTISDMTGEMKYNGTHRTQLPDGYPAVLDHIVQSGVNNGECSSSVLDSLVENLENSIMLAADSSCLGSGEFCECSPIVRTAVYDEYVDSKLSQHYCEYHLISESNCKPKAVKYSGGAGGDPHFHTLHGEYFGYHGICDLVMVQSSAFGSGQGLDLHIRTEERGGYSSISHAALRIGNDVLEVGKDGSYFLDGEVDVDMPADLAGHKVTMKRGTHADVFPSVMGEGIDESELDDSIIFNVDLGKGDHIQIQAWRDYLWTNVKFSQDNLKDSIGLMGTPGKPGKIARDRLTNIENPNEFGQEWQVLENEPNLFQTVRLPQHPDKCIMPVADGRRRLGHLKLARDVCAHVEGPKKEFCILDVSKTGDIKMAIAPFYRN